MDNLPYILTFGVELEFIARYDPEVYRNKLRAAEGKLWPADSSRSLFEKYGILVRRHMTQILKENEFCNYSHRSKGFSEWKVDTDGAVIPFDSTASDINGKWYPIEVITPVLYFCRASLEHVERAVKLLVSKFQLYTNEICGMHVHVGNEDRGFTMGTLKHFCSLITVFERQIDSLHTPTRLQSLHAKPMRHAFSTEATLTDKLSIIGKFDVVDDLLLQMHCTQYADRDRNMAYNFFNLQETDEGPPLRTIEFRQHRGTLDPRLISNWVKVVCSLVKISYGGRSLSRDLIERHLNDTEYTAVDLFRDLNLPDLAEFYAPLVFRHGTDMTSNASSEDVEPGVVRISSPGEFETAWEREFAPRPRSELESNRQSTSADPQSGFELEPYDTSADGDVAHDW